MTPQTTPAGLASRDHRGDLLWFRSRRLHLLAPALFFAALAACLGGNVFLPVPTLGGSFHPVLLSAVAATAAATLVIPMVRQHLPEFTSVRRNAARALVVVGGILLLATACGVSAGNAIGVRGLLGMVGFGLLAARLRWGSVLPAAYFLVAGTLGAGSSQDPLAAQPWAWLVDGTSTPTAWVVALTILATGIMVQLLVRPRL